MAKSMLERYMKIENEKRYTAEDYQKTNENEIWTLIEGVKIMSPSPNLLHQDTVADLLESLRVFVRKTSLGKVVPSPFDVYFDRENITQPDLLYISKERFSLLKSNGVFGAPDLCVEVVSPSSVTMDNVVKKDLYASFGVEEYWIVFPEERAIEVFRLDGGKYSLYSHCDGEGRVESRVLPGFSVAVTDLWKEE